MSNAIVTVTYYFPGAIRCSAVPERFGNHELAEKAAQQLTHTSYLDDGANKIVTRAAEIVEACHVWRLPEPRGRTPSDYRCT